MYCSFLIRAENQIDMFIRGFNSWKHASCANQRFVHHRTNKSHKLAEINDDKYFTHKKSAATILQEMK